MPDVVRKYYGRFRDIIAFSVIGVATNVTFLFLFSELVRYQVSPQIAAALCYLGALVSGYFLNRSWSFRDQSAIRTTLWKYLILYALGYAIVVIMHWSLPALGVPAIAIQIVAIILVMGFNFAAMKYIIFKGRKP
jgi:putative flippase GtrA